MIKRVVLLHGLNSNPSDGWYPWLAKKALELGLEFHAPTLPGGDDPHLAEWTAALTAVSPGADTALIGHSRGGVAVLRWLEQQSAGIKVAKTILAATNSGFVQKMPFKDESNFGFYTERGYEFAGIQEHSAEFVVMHSKDDPQVPYEAGLENAEGLNAELVSFEDRGHLGRKLTEFPELLARLKS